MRLFPLPTPVLAGHSVLGRAFLARAFLAPAFLARAVLAPACLMLAVLALAGCHGDPNEEAAQCPKAYLLPDAARLARYDGRGQDISNLVLNVRITDVKGACTGKLGTKLEGAHAHVVMVVTRGPAATSSEADIAYKIGVVRGNDILAENSYVQHVTFPDNVNAVQVTGQDIPMKLPTSKTITGPDYHIYFWLDLTREQLEANRKNRNG